MALLDLSEVMFDPDLVTGFTVIRRAETVGNNGRSTLVETTITTDPVTGYPIVGIINHAGSAEIIRRDDGTMMSRMIGIITSFRLRGPAPGFQPDIVLLEGTRYTISEVLPYTRYGSGFVEAVATSMNATDAPPA